MAIIVESMTRLLETVCHSAGLPLGYEGVAQGYEEDDSDLPTFYWVPRRQDSPSPWMDVTFTPADQREYFPEGTTPLQILERAFQGNSILARTVLKKMQDIQKLQKRVQCEEALKEFFRKVEFYSRADFLAYPIWHGYWKYLKDLSEEAHHLLEILWRHDLTITDWSTGQIGEDTRTRVLVVYVPPADSTYCKEHPQKEKDLSALVARCGLSDLSISLSVFDSGCGSGFRWDVEDQGYRVYLFPPEVEQQLPGRYVWKLYGRMSQEEKNNIEYLIEMQRGNGGEYTLLPPRF